jgi:hypothetical protein
VSGSGYGSAAGQIIAAGSVAAAPAATQRSRRTKYSNLGMAREYQLRAALRRKHERRRWMRATYAFDAATCLLRWRHVIEFKPDQPIKVVRLELTSDAYIRVYKCPSCAREMRLTVWASDPAA